jgi:6-phosphogluconolactonase
MQKSIKIYSNDTWAEKSAKIIYSAINITCLEKGFCKILLTGGQSAEYVYNFLSELLTSDLNLYFYFGDERCVSPEDPESNFGLVMRSLFKNNLPKNFKIFRIYGEALDLEMEVKRYETVLPNEIDILLLSIGEDAHIASLFPGDISIHECDKRLAIVNGPKPPNPRITITPKIISSVNKVYCFASGNAKSKALSNVFQDRGDSLTYPAKLIVNCNWLIDISAAQNINNEK